MLEYDIIPRTESFILCPSGIQVFMEIKKLKIIYSDRIDLSDITDKKFKSKAGTITSR